MALIETASLTIGLRTKTAMMKAIFLSHKKKVNMAKWHYIQSETLKQQIAFDEESHWLFCRDGTKYSPKELETITQNFQKASGMPLSVHILKKEFDGKIVNFIPAEKEATK